MKECQINITITSQDDEGIEGDYVFDVFIPSQDVEKTLMIAARGAMKALADKGLKVMFSDPIGPDLN